MINGTDIRSCILKTLAYYDIFLYPLTTEEIFHNCSLPVSREEIQNELETLLSEIKIFRHHSYYDLQNNAGIVERRIKGNERAGREMEKAIIKAAHLSRFPYIRCIAVSGSLSKNYADENTDMDFFIITKANRLWIARTFLHLNYKFKKITGGRPSYCMNYYVDEEGLEIVEKNIFTATEISTLVPLYGGTTYQRFMQHNNWILDYLPQFKPAMLPVAKNNSFFKKIMETLFNNALGSLIDKALMKGTDKRWQNKIKRQQKNQKGEPVSLCASRHFSKPDPGYFQQKILNWYDEKTRSLIDVALLSKPVQ